MPNLSKIKPISWQKCKFLHFSVCDTFITKYESCHYVQNDPHKFKIKLEKFDFDILCHFGVIKESLPGGRNPPPPPDE